MIDISTVSFCLELSASASIKCNYFSSSLEISKMEKELAQIYTNSSGMHNRRLSAVYGELTKKLKSKSIKRLNIRMLDLRNRSESLTRKFQIVNRRKFIRISESDANADKYIMLAELYRLKLEYCGAIKKLIVIRTKFWQRYFQLHCLFERRLDDSHKRLLRGFGFVGADEVPTLAVNAIISMAMEQFRKLIEPTFHFKWKIRMEMLVVP